MGFQPSYRTEAQIYTKYILQQKPEAKIAILYQNDDFGKDYPAGVKDVLGDKFDKMTVTASYETTDATIDSQITSLQASGADVLFVYGPQKAVTMSVRKVYDIGWRPLMFLPDISSSVGGSLRPAGVEKAVGVISGGFLKDPSDPQWQDDPDVKAWNVFMDKYLPNMDRGETAPVFATAWGNVLKKMIAACGDNLTRDCIMYQATHLANVTVPMLLPGVTINTTPTDYRAIKQLQLQRFDGVKYQRFGDVLSAN